MEIAFPRTEAEAVALSRVLTVEETRTLISPTADIFARYLLSSERLKHLTLAFINAVLEDAGKSPAESVIIKNPFSLKDSPLIKETILDVEVRDSGGTLYDVEIQNAVSEEFYKRLQYYGANLYRGQLAEGNTYSMLRSCVLIALTSGHLNRKIHKPHHFQFTADAEDHDSRFFPEDASDYHILELDKFELSADALYTLDEKGEKQRPLSYGLFKWLRFFKDGARKDFMQKYNETDTMIKDAKTEYENFIGDDAARMAHLRHEMYLHDVATAKEYAQKTGFAEGRRDGMKTGIEQGLKRGIQQGIQQGIRQGIRQEAIETAQKLKGLGISADIIAQSTGLSAEEIAKM